ncbi:unnamed protein product [Arabidopsis thaliana]|uniref:FANCL C-terminal domain-containing protein n=1 Tax=Arabidopsis thaliana TaxID=3702 RepID=Q9FLH3_ARATH|nr:unnamed protein product [Arabidopsis thaliana]
MMNVSGECVGRERCEELAKSSSFYRKVYSERINFCFDVGCAIYVYTRMVNKFKIEGCNAPIPKGRSKTLLHSLFQPARASAIRRIDAGNDCIIIVHIDFKDPKSLPESNERSFPENLECILGTELPKPLGLQVEDDQQQVECGICYAQFLPTDEELGARSGTRTDYTCENISCNKSFHSLCLTDWLRSITTTRQSFDVLFGNCPYCSDPVAVKTSNK